MRSRSRNPFSTVKTAGLLLPIDLLARIADADEDLHGLTPDSYHLGSNERLNEAAARAWNECLSAWKSFRQALAKLPTSDPGTTVTRERWLLPLFNELGYGRLQPQKAVAIEDKTYAFSHVWGGHVPIHLISCRLEIDKRAPGSTGAAARSPYSLVQEFLNRSAQHRWGFVSNGRKLVILRDNASLARAANVEFDLDAMFDGEIYPDFALLFLVCHQSRVEIPSDGKPEDCWLEKWSKLADDQGTRAREKLRDGVENAIKALGAGFLTTRGNSEMRDRLRSGSLATQDYYRQLLRVVYRLLLLLVAEEKKTEEGQNLLHPPGTPDDIRRRYARFYSIGRLRSLASQRRGTSHSDLYESLKLLFNKLRTGYAPLGIPGLGSFLFSPTATPDLDSANLANEALLDAIRELCITEDTSGRGGSVRRPVDFANLGSDELGSVYESLLELHPNIETDEGPFTLGTAAGHERKTTGSYYTPTSLINCLLDSALDPVVKNALDEATPQEAEKELLNLKVCDPACGSGHFLIAAAERMAKHLAILRTGDDEPSTLEIQHAKRDVIGRCIYGVDVNPMSVELCKVALWMEALEPGKPFSFLEHHIQCGNSLIGASPAHLAKGIPDEAFAPAEGDDKKLCVALKKQNKMERQGQGDLFEERSPWEQLGNLAAAIAELDTLPDETPDHIHAKEVRYRTLVETESYRNSGKFLADLWCAAFVWRKDRSFDYAITDRVFRKVEKSPHDITPWMYDEIQRLRRQYGFFHWHLAFPNVFRVPVRDETPERSSAGWIGGFDAILGNPPWVRQELLKPVKQFLQVFESYKSTADSSIYFLERAVQITKTGRRIGLLTPNKWFRAEYGELLRTFLRERVKAHLLIDFGHAKKLFVDADTFPAAIILEPARQRVGDEETFLFVRAHDSDRKQHDLTHLIHFRSVKIPHAQLRATRWELDDPGINQLLCRLRTSGTKLSEYVGRAPLRGLISGLNEAFYIDTSTRNQLVDEDPECAPLIKRLLRGRDIGRWLCKDADQWHIVIPSSQNRMWPWSDCLDEIGAESVFSQTYPGLYRHLKQYEERLRHREDQGRFWWELRACDYYGLFENPKIVVQCIAYYSQFALDLDRRVLNNKAIFLPTNDLYVLAILNSRVMWWIVSRVFQHMKDEGLSIDVQFLVDLPIPAVADELQSSIRKETQGLLDECRKEARLSELLRREQIISGLVERAFALSEDERALLTASLPPRDPLVTLSGELSKITDVAAPRPPAPIVVVDPVFPSTPRQKQLCGALLDLVNADPGLKGTAYLEALVLLTKPGLCAKLLHPNEQKTLKTLSRKAPDDLIRSQDKSLHWYNVRAVLAANGTIEVSGSGNGEAFKPGPRRLDVRPTYPPISADLIAHVVKAARSLRELQEVGAAQTQETKQIQDELANLVGAELAA